MQINSLVAGAARGVAAGNGFASDADGRYSAGLGFEAQAMSDMAGGWGG